MDSTDISTEHAEGEDNECEVGNVTNEVKDVSDETQATVSQSSEQISHQAKSIDAIVSQVDRSSDEDVAKLDYQDVAKLDCQDVAKLGSPSTSSQTAYTDSVSVSHISASHDSQSSTATNTKDKSLDTDDKQEVAAAKDSDEGKTSDGFHVQDTVPESQPVNVPRLGQSPTLVLPNAIEDDTGSLNSELFNDEVESTRQNDDSNVSHDQPLEIKTDTVDMLDSCLSSITSDNTESSLGDSMISRDSVLSNVKSSNLSLSSVKCETVSNICTSVPEPNTGADQELQKDTSQDDEEDRPDGANSSIEYTSSQIPVEYDEPEFMWDEYLEETGATAAQPTSFKHVECSLRSGFEKGMKVEVSNKAPQGSYWIASIVMSCGQLLRLRWEGIGEVTSADFWCDTCSSDIHPLGWCVESGKLLQPPEEYKDAIEDPVLALEKITQGAKSIPSYLLDGSTGPSPIDQIKQGMRIEVQHELDPHCIWLVKIIENVGGRLLLRPEGAETATHDFWLFYTDYRLHPMNWGKEHSYQYKPFTYMNEGEKSDAHWKDVLENSLKDSAELPLPADIFKDQVEVFEHNFKVGWKAEVLHPRHRSIFSPGTITKVIDSFYFIVELDDCSPEAEKECVQMCCHGGSQTVFPMHWCMYKGQKLTPPRGWQKRDLDWQEYLLATKAEAAPEDAFNNQMVFDSEFSKGMKLEAVNPAHPWQICAATITRIVDNLMWLHLDNSPKMVSNHIVDVESHEIFPVGWCESNNYTLKPPRRTNVKKKVVASIPETPASTNDTKSVKAYKQIKNGNGGSWCPKIYFNHRCFSGPFLSKGRIAELPKCVGPGPVTLVLKEVLSMLINVAYKSSRVLRELQLEGPPNPHMHPQILKAKYKGKSYQALVEICKSSDQIEEFCRQVCIKLECCPNLFSPMFVNGSCPENCHQLTKTKYTYYYGKTKKKRKIGRPPGGHSNLEHGPKKPGKRRKKKKINLAHRKKSNSADSEDTLGDNGDDMDLCDGDSNSTGSLDRREMDDPDFRPAPGESWASARGRKRKYQRHLPPPSEIKTRGAKLPKYSFERKTHQKVLITSPKHTPSQKIKSSSQASAFRPVKTEPMLTLDTNPLYWSVKKVVEFIKTTDCVNLARIFKDQEIDGQALLLLTLPTVQEYMELKLGPAIKLCHHIERVKIAFYEQYAD